MPKVVSYEEKQVDRKKNIYNMLVQSFEDVKLEQNNSHGWNRIVSDLNGMVIKLSPSNQLVITMLRYEVADRQTLLRIQDDGYKLVDELSKALKKKFREQTKKTLKLTKSDQDVSIEKTSMLQAPTSGYFGNSFSRPWGRYLIRNSIVYDFDATL